VEVTGPGKVEVISWDPETKKIALTDSDEETSVTFLIPPYRKWHSFQDGKELKISSNKIGRQRVMQVAGVTDGIITLNYADSTVETLLKILSTIILLACFLGIIARSRAIPTDMIGAKTLRTTYFVLTALLGLSGVLVVIGAFVGSTYAVQHEWLAGDEKNGSVLSVIHRGGILDHVVTPKQSCIRAYVRDPGREHQWECSSAELTPKLVHAPKRYGRIPSCLSVTIPKNGTTKLTMALPEETNTVKGYLHPMKKQNGRWRTTTKWSKSISATMVFGTTAIDIGPRYQITPPATADTVTFEITSPQLTKICVEAVALK
jgi:hypothetical protein